jgi:hypothetical protein
MKNFKLSYVKSENNLIHPFTNELLQNVIVISMMSKNMVRGSFEITTCPFLLEIP